MSGNIFNSKGTRVGVVDGATIFSLNGQELYHLNGINICRLSGELVGHLNGAHGSDKRLDRSSDKLFPTRGSSKDPAELGEGVISHDIPTFLAFTSWLTRLNGGPGLTSKLTGRLAFIRQA